MSTDVEYTDVILVDASTQPRKRAVSATIMRLAGSIMLAELVAGAYLYAQQQIGL